LEELTKYYNGKYYTDNIQKVITNIQENLYKENYQTVSKNITKLLTLVPFPLYNSPDEEICVKF
jgi:hypothetical protein